MSEHLKLDTNFLDKVTSPKSGSVNSVENSPKENKPKPDRKTKWKAILIIGAIILFFAWVIFSDNSGNPKAGIYTSPNINPSSTNSDTVVIGEYRCSSYNYDKAVALNPDESDAQITLARNDLDDRANELDSLEKEIDGSYVNENSPQYQINKYNATVAEYNTKLATYKRDAASFKTRIDKYNAQIEIFNNYLENNCTPNR